MIKQMITAKFTCLTIASGYFIFSGLWGLFSNQLFAVLMNRPNVATQSMGIGYWFFITMSTGMLYWLLRYWELAISTSEESLRKVNRSLRSFSECTKAITRADDELKLMERICRICVEVGGHQMAWVAFGENNPERSLHAVAHWGAKGCFLDSLNASWADTERGRGPAGTSIRTGKITVFQNLLTNPLYSPWRSAVKTCGYNSCIALPLSENRNTFGSLVIFDSKPLAFDIEEAKLLEELAGDLSYGIKTLRIKTASDREIEERLMLATVMDQTSDGVITFDAKGAIQYVNPSFVALCGVPAEESIGVNIHDFECGKRNPIFYRAILSVFNSNKVFSGHFVNKKRDGTEYDMDARIAPVFDNSGKLVRYVITIRDVSESVDLQHQLRQAQKMEALATLSGGIAHDFNNILAIIITNMEMSLEDVEPNSHLHKSMGLVLKAGLRGKSLVKQFLTMSRQDEQPEKNVKIEEIIGECLLLLRSTLPTTIELRKQINPVGMISADPTQIHQVIINLCTNAGDAMREQGGVLDLTLSEVELNHYDVARYHGLKPGKYVKLIVADTGHGMDREVLERIFDPFYTTKSQGKGTGLGLSTAHGIIKNHRGYIAANSIVNVGTTFVILLPIAVEKESSTTTDIPSVQMVAGKGRILFVDDETDYVTGMQTALERMGYVITAETDSIRMLDIFRNNPDDFDLLITDQTMPHMTGAVLAQNILTIRPDFPIILCSGSSPDADTAVSPEKASNMGIRKVLMKPVGRNELNQAIQQLLNP